MGHIAGYKVNNGLIGGKKVETPLQGTKQAHNVVSINGCELVGRERIERRRMEGGDRRLHRGSSGLEGGREMQLRRDGSEIQIRDYGCPLRSREAF